MKTMLKTAESNLGVIFVIIGVLIALAYIIIACFRDFSTLELILFQIFSLILSIAGSFLFGKQSAKKNAEEMIKPHARSAFRRVLGLHQSFYRMLEATDEMNFYKEDVEKNKDMQIAVIKSILIEQTTIVTDAIEDWRDLIPEDLEELERKARERSKSKNIGM